MRVLVTRALEDAQPLAAELAVDGIEAVLAPMLSYEFLEPLADPELRPAAYLVTSRNGAEALARYTRDRNSPVFAVGEATAERLRGHQFEAVESADGDAAALVSLVARQIQPDAGPLCFLSAETVAGDVEDRLRQGGYTLRRIVAYRSVPAASLPDEAAARMRAGEVAGVLFFSPKTGRAFVDLVTLAGLTASCSDMTAYCISDAVAESVAALPWAAIRVAPHPRKRDLLALLAAPRHKDA